MSDQEVSEVEFDWNTPFTLVQVFQAFNLGSVFDPTRARPLVAELIKKGYTQRVRKGKRLWAKWPNSGEFTMPNIP